MPRRKKVTKKEVSEGLRRLAFGEIKDAVYLLFENEDTALKSLPSLDLFNVSEIKRVKGGGMEIKFFDRLKALDKLAELVGSEDRQSALSFYDALEKSAGRASELYGEKNYDKL